MIILLVNNHTTNLRFNFVIKYNWTVWFKNFSIINFCIAYDVKYYIEFIDTAAIICGSSNCLIIISLFIKHIIYVCMGNVLIDISSVLNWLEMFHNIWVICPFIIFIDYCIHCSVDDNIECDD